jgi:hypothetical protein
MRHGANGDSPRRPLEGTLVTRDLKQRAVDSRLSTGGRARGGRSAAQGRLRLGNCSPFPSRHVRYVVKTKPVSTHRSPALRRRSFSRVLWTFSAETHTAGRIRGSPFVRRLPYGTYRSRQRHGGCEKEPRRLTRPSDRELDTVLRCYRLATRTPISSQSNKVPRAVRAAQVTASSSRSLIAFGSMTRTAHRKPPSVATEKIRYFRWSPPASRCGDGLLPYFSAMRTSARIHGWMQHWYLSSPASSSSSLDEAPGGIIPPPASAAHSGATSVNPVS